MFDKLAQLVSTPVAGVPVGLWIAVAIMLIVVVIIIIDADYHSN